MIVKVKNDSYTLYEQLLLKRDWFRKEAAQTLITYTRVFGDLINAVFEKKIECIRLKRTIAACQACINRGETIPFDDIQTRIRAEMTHYYAELEEMLAGTRAAKACSVLPAAEAAEIKRIYRKLARLLHPDIHPQTAQMPELKDLWNRIVIAYHHNQLEELRELEVLACAAAERLGAGESTVDIPDIEEKITRLEREIHEILTTEPYTCKAVLADREQTAEKKVSLQEELNEYEEYSESLAQILDDMLMGTGGRITWHMN